jgi:hypothetical protein
VEFEFSLKRTGSLCTGEVLVLNTRRHFCIHRDKWHAQGMKSRNKAMGGRKSTSFRNDKSFRLMTTHYYSYLTTQYLHYAY